MKRRTPRPAAHSIGPIRRTLSALTIFAVCTAGPMVGGIANAEPVPVPDADPFYAAPADLAALGNGAIIGSREITPFGLALNLPVTTWQVQYKSADAQGIPTTGTATVVVPKAQWTGPGARPLVSYQMAEDSPGRHCAASYSIRAGLAAGPNNSNSEVGAAVTLLQRNWALVFSDYQGPQSRFLDEKQSAHSVLDGIRAALAFAPAGLSPGRATPAGPTYVWHSTGDDVLPIADADRVVQNWCAAGAEVTYMRTHVPTHTTAGLAGLPGAVDYLADRFTGIPAPGCRFA